MNAPPISRVEAVRACYISRLARRHGLRSLPTVHSTKSKEWTASSGNQREGSIPMNPPRDEADIVIPSGYPRRGLVHLFNTRRNSCGRWLRPSCFIIASPGWAAEATITDGDTLIWKGTTYRLDGVDAPETDQVCLYEKGAAWSCGIEARDQFRKFVEKRAVQCEGKTYDTVYRNRRIGICRIEGEPTTLNQWLVRVGWALNFEPYAKGRFKADQDDARDKSRGLWKGCFAPPQTARVGARIPPRYWVQPAPTARSSRYAIFNSPLIPRCRLAARSKGIRPRARM